MDQVSSHARAITSFSSTISKYQEHKHNGGLDPIVEDAPSSAPTTSDFICDVERSAAKCLDREELAHFTKYIKTGAMVVEETETLRYDNELHRHLQSLAPSDRSHVANTDLSMRTKLGTYFFTAGIYPLNAYVTPTGNCAS